MKLNGIHTLGVGILVGIILTACGGQTTDESPPAPIPPAVVQNDDVVAKTKDVSNAPASDTSNGSVALSAFDISFTIDNVSTDWLNESLRTLDATITVDNVSLTEALWAGFGWAWVCAATGDEFDRAVDYVIELESFPEPGWDFEFTSPLKLESLTAASVELPTIAVPLDLRAADGSDCGQPELYLTTRVIEASHLDFSSREPGVDGMYLDGNPFVRTGIRVNDATAELPAFGAGPSRLALGDLCDALVDQDLEAFLGVPITVWSEVEGRPSGIGCSLEGVEVMVYNGVSATDGFESAMETHYKGTEPIDGTNSGYLDGGDDPYFGYVAIDDVVVSFGFTSMTKEQLTVFGRLVERVGTDLLER